MQMLLTSEHCQAVLAIGPSFAVICCEAQSLRATKRLLIFLVSSVNSSTARAVSNSCTGVAEQRSQLSSMQQRLLPVLHRRLLTGTCHLVTFTLLCLSFCSSKVFPSQCVLCTPTCMPTTSTIPVPCTAVAKQALASQLQFLGFCIGTVDLAKMLKECLAAQIVACYRPGLPQAQSTRVMYCCMHVLLYISLTILYVCDCPTCCQYRYFHIEPCCCCCVV